MSQTEMLICRDPDPDSFSTRVPSPPPPHPIPPPHMCASLALQHKVLSRLADADCAVHVGPLWAGSGARPRARLARLDAGGALWLQRRGARQHPVRGALPRLESCRSPSARRRRALFLSSDICTLDLIGCTRLSEGERRMTAEVRADACFDADVQEEMQECANTIVSFEIISNGSGNCIMPRRSIRP